MIYTCTIAHHTHTPYVHTVHKPMSIHKGWDHLRGYFLPRRGLYGFAPGLFYRQRAPLHQDSSHLCAAQTPSRCSLVLSCG